MKKATDRLTSGEPVTRVNDKLAEVRGLPLITFKPEGLKMIVADPSHEVLTRLGVERRKGGSRLGMRRRLNLVRAMR